MAIAGAPVYRQVLMSRQAFLYISHLGMDYKLTSHTHRLDAIKCLLARRDSVIMVFVWQSQLVQDLQLTPRVPDGLKTRHSHLLLCAKRKATTKLKPGGKSK
jgi:hypothetical protein